MDSLNNISKDVFSCKKCGLYKERMNPVPGAGNPKAEIIFVGEAPGANEDMRGIPFCGAAGRVLDRLLEKAGIRREDIYITNILKCRPPENRNPREEEIKACVPYLERQMAIIKPRIICCLGNFAVSYIMRKFGLGNKIRGISKIHGKIFSVQTLFDSIEIIPFYHPAVAIYNVNMINILEKDFEVLRKH